MLGLEVVEENGTLLALLTPVLDDDARAVDDLACVTLTVQNACEPHVSNEFPSSKFSQTLLTKTSPLAELLAIGNLDQRNFMLGAQSDDQLLVGLLLARLVQDAHVRLSPVQGLRSLAQTTGKTIVHQSKLQHTLQGVQNGHLTLGGGIGGNFDFLRNIGGVVLFYVRLDDCHTG